MFDVTAQLVNNQEEINCLDKILYGKNSWTRLSLINDEIVINLQSKKIYVFSDSVLCLGKVLQHPESNEAWKNSVAGATCGPEFGPFWTQGFPNQPEKVFLRLDFLTLRDNVFLAFVVEKPSREPWL